MLGLGAYGSDSEEEVVPEPVDSAPQIDLVQTVTQSFSRASKVYHSQRNFFKQNFLSNIFFFLMKPQA